jgi:hypothetical protein
MAARRPPSTSGLVVLGGPSGRSGWTRPGVQAGENAGAPGACRPHRHGDLVAGHGESNSPTIELRAGGG